MKIKGISFFEQHVEKFVLAGFGIVLVAVATMQFVTSPNRVQMDGQQVDPADIEPRLKQKADAVKARLAESAAPADLIEGQVPEVLDEFRAALDGGVAPRRSLPPIEPSLAAAILPTDVAPGEAIFHVPSLAAPTMVGVHQETDTLADTALTQYPELAKRYEGTPAQGVGPFDITWAIPVAEVDLGALREEFHAADPAKKPPMLAIPTLWYNDSLWIVDVVFERQQRRSDGTWSDAETVGVLPGQFSFRKEIPTADAGLRDAVFSYLSQRDRALEVLQPEFLPTKGNVFSPAGILGQVEVVPAGTDAVARRVQQQYNRKKADRDRIAAQLKDAGGPLEPEKPEDRQQRDRERRERDRDTQRGGGGGGGGAAPPGGGGGGGLSGGGGFGKRNEGGGSKANDEASKKKRIALTGRLKGLDAEVAQLEEQLKALMPDASTAGSDSVKLLDLSKDDRALVWAHDIDVTSGKTYRYRVHLEAYNPFFARKRQLVAEQQSLAEAFVLSTRESDWSQPVTVEPPVTFFVADAAAGDGRLGLGSAKVEVYRFFDGERRLETFSVQPGDRIGGPAERNRTGPSIDFTTDWYVVDVVEDTAGDRSDRRGAQLVVRRAGDTTLVVRSPRADLDDDTRIRYSDEVEAARIAAMSRGKDEPDGSGPGGGPGGPPGGSGLGAPGGGSKTGGT